VNEHRCRGPDEGKPFQRESNSRKEYLMAGNEQKYQGKTEIWALDLASKRPLETLEKRRRR
jgi:hypothetical protein